MGFHINKFVISSEKCCLPICRVGAFMTRLSAAEMIALTEAEGRGTYLLLGTNLINELGEN